MENWDLVILGEQLQKIQSEMQESHTKIWDALSSMKTEILILKDRWQGIASEEFIASFSDCLEDACDCAIKTGEWIAFPAVAESAFARCEAEIGGLISGRK